MRIYIILKQDSFGYVNFFTYSGMWMIIFSRFLLFLIFLVDSLWSIRLTLIRFTFEDENKNSFPFLGVLISKHKGMILNDWFSKISFSVSLPSLASAAVALSSEYSIPDRRARVRGSPSETPPCTLMAPGACKIRRGYNVL